MGISAKDVMSLRRRTGLGMMECKHALSETDGQMDAAMELLRKKLKGKMDERADRAASEGAVAVARSADGIVMVELLSETDFAARNQGFIDGVQKLAALGLGLPDGEVAFTDQMMQIVDELRITIKENISPGRAVKMSGGKLGSYVHHNLQIGVIVQGEGDLSDELLRGLCQHIAAAVPTPLGVDEAALPTDEVETQRQVAIREAQESGKPAPIAEKIASGKLRKWVDEHTLVGQIYIRELDAKKPVRHYLPAGAVVRKFVRYRLGG